ncbi:hypothetical protein C8Q80DRAFT_1149229 [Daedaleopsis nitida]|nr:hypothetical protein C8Q80DRAFT_1149229 [Daedaleopsis nitida]
MRSLSPHVSLRLPRNDNQPRSTAFQDIHDVAMSYPRRQSQYVLRGNSVSTMHTDLLRFDKCQHHMLRI